MNDGSELDEALALENLRSRLPNRPRIVDIRHEPYVDSLGQHELLIVVVLADDTRDEDMRTDNLQSIREAILGALRGDKRYAYIRFVTEVEFADSDED